MVSVAWLLKATEVEDARKKNTTCLRPLSHTLFAQQNHAVPSAGLRAHTNQS